MADDTPQTGDAGQDLSSLSPFRVLQKQGTAPVSSAPAPNNSPVPTAPVIGSAAAAHPPQEPRVVSETPKQPFIPPKPTAPVPPAFPPAAQTQAPTSEPSSQVQPEPQPIQDGAPKADTTQSDPVQLSKEDLLKQAAEAPAMVFEVPRNIPVMPHSAPHKEAPKPSTAVPLPPQAPPQTNQAKPLPPPPPPPKPETTKPQPQVAHPQPNQGGASNVVPLSPRPVPQAAALGGIKKQKSPVLGIILGLLLVIILFAGGVVALAWNGMRIPYVYTAISGLPSDGSQLAAKSLAYIESREALYFSGGVDIKSKDQSEGEPALPSLNGETQTAAPITRLVSTIKEAEETRGSLARVNLQLQQGGSGMAMPFLANTSSIDSEWLVNTPANQAEPLIQVDSSAVHKTLLFPALRPLAIGEVLKGLQTSNGYESSHRSATYRYRINMGKLPDILPKDAVLKNTEASVTYAWKTAQPTKASVELEFTYLGVTYQYTETWNSLRTSASDIWSTLSTGENTEVRQASIEEFVIIMGIPDLALLPNTLIDNSIVPTPSGNDDPSPTPTPTSTTTISPTGQGITSVQEGIIQAPAVPISPANQEAKDRDVQRKRDLIDLQNALERYKNVTGSYPISSGIEQTLQSSTLLKALVPSYITRLPVDPQPHTYWYEYYSNGSTYVIRGIAEDAADTEAHAGSVYHFYEYKSK